VPSPPCPRMGDAERASPLRSGRHRHRRQVAVPVPRRGDRAAHPGASDPRVARATGADRRRDPRSHARLAQYRLRDARRARPTAADVDPGARSSCQAAARSDRPGRSVDPSGARLRHTPRRLRAARPGAPALLRRLPALHRRAARRARRARRRAVRLRRRRAAGHAQGLAARSDRGRSVDRVSGVATPRRRQRPDADRARRVDALGRHLHRLL